VSELTGVERPASRGSVHSVNFSLPTGLRPTSPVGNRRLTSPEPGRQPPRITSPSNQNLVYDPNTRSFLPASEIFAIEQRIQDAANAPVKKQKRVAPKQATGTHLADGTVGGRPRGTAVDEMEAAKQAPKPIPTQAPSALITQESTPTSAPTAVEPPVAPAPTTTTVPKKKKKRMVVTSESESEHSYAPNSSDNESDFSLSSPPSISKTRAGGALGKKPSIVREEREREEEEDEDAKRFPQPEPFSHLESNRATSPSPLPRSSAGRGHGRGQAAASAAFAHGRQETRSSSQPAPAPIDTSPANEKVLGLRGSVRGGRVQSVSPARTHFATTPDHLAVKHAPPPRSLSPRKSALKHHNGDSPRGLSPAGATTGHGQNLSEVSNDSTVASEDQPLPRKKAVRVSFDESNYKVGEAAGQETLSSPIVANPQQTLPAKRGWFSLSGRGKRKETSVIEDDEVMQPRPALPSFGSVRERKHKPEPLEERPLVKPAEPIEKEEPVTVQKIEPLIHRVESPTSPASPLFTTPTGEVIDYPMGQSNDHVVGSVIAQDAATKNAANISKSREPLPPQVLSVEGSGYHSDTDSTVSAQHDMSSSDAGAIVATEINPSRETEPLNAESGTPPGEQVTHTNGTNGDIPEILLSKATPTLNETEDRNGWPHIPGGWEGSNTSDSESTFQDEIVTPVEYRAIEPTPATIGIAEPLPGEAQPGSPVLSDIAAENSHEYNSLIDEHPAILEETEDESVYSDAAEELADQSDVEGGFLSLDAVVESPVVSNFTPGLALDTPPDSPTTRVVKERAYKQSQLSRKTSEPDLDEGWDKAQQYWKSLSDDKKRQLEEEAKEEAGDEDSESTIEAPKPAPKPKKKKKVITQPAPAAPLESQRPTSPERMYMIQPGTKAGPDGFTPSMRSSMRAEPPKPAGETHIRKSMRGQGSLHNSLREETVQPRGSIMKKNRPLSVPTQQIKADPDAVKTHVRALSAASAAAAQRNSNAAATAPKPTLRRKGSAESDSSFKRSKASENTTFRRSMRGSVDNGRKASPTRSSRFSLRSLSPTGSTTGRRPFNSAPPMPVVQTSMRGSMRDSAPPRSSMANRPKSPVGSSLRLGFGRASSAKPAQKKPVPSRARSSRFADSSDEDDARPAFRSRFVDSSDDDDDAPPVRGGGFGRGTMRASAPVRPIPRAAGVEDGDSSDLPDSDDERTAASPGLKRTKQRQNGTTAAGQNLASGSLRRSGSGSGMLATPSSPTATTPLTRPRRGSLMSILRRKKDPSSKVRKADVESAARRDTPLERSKSDLAAVKRNDSHNTISGARPQSPKLQKRNTAGSGSWPLPTLALASPPPKIPGGAEDGRPFSADAGGGVVGAETNGITTGRPEIGTRRFTAQGLPGELDVNGVGKPHKKKKFGKLRRMFGLDE
jgi:serine/arginine repetitive matrix protein 2